MNTRKFTILYLSFFFVYLSISLASIFDPPPGGRKFPGARDERVVEIDVQQFPSEGKLKIEITEELDQEPSTRTQIKDRLKESAARGYVGSFDENVHKLEEHHGMFNIFGFFGDQYQHLKHFLFGTKELAKEKGQQTYQAGKERAEETYEYAKGKGQETIQKGKQVLEETAERGKEAAERGKEALERGMEMGKEAVERGKGAIEQGMEKGKEAAEKGKEALERGVEMGKEAVGRGKEKIIETYETAKEKAAEVVESVKETAESVAEKAREKTLETVGTVKEVTEGVYETAKRKGEEAIEYTKSKASESAETVKETTQSMKGKAQETVETLKDKTTETIEQGTKKAKEAGRYMKETVEGVYEELKEKAEETLEGTLGGIKGTVERGTSLARKIYSTIRNILWGSKERAKRKLASVTTVNPYEEVELYWNEFISSIPELSTLAKTRLRDEGLRALHELESKKALMDTEKFTEAKKKLSEEMEHLENTFGRQIEAVQKRFDNLWKRIETAHKTGKIDFNLPHHAVMKCGSCGKEYTFVDFLDMFEDYDHEMSFPDTLPSDQKQLEEFYEGWANWANYLKLKCTQCGASNWHELVIMESS